MTDFDRIVDRSKSKARKWMECTNGEVPMWIADMDFPVAPPILDALKERLEHPFFGYDKGGLDSLPCIVEHYKKLYDVDVELDWIVPVWSVIPGITLGCLAVGGDTIYSIPMYMGIRGVPKKMGINAIEVSMRKEGLKYFMDIDAMEKAITPEVKTLILCHPHNPVGRCFTREELLEILDFAKRHDLVIISDEIHCELVLEGEHIPLFDLAKGTGVKVMTVSSAAKICNIPGIHMAYCVIPDEDLRHAVEEQLHGFFGRGEALNGLAMKKAFDGSCDEWKEDLREYLRGNRDYLEERIAKIPGLTTTHCEATYLAWIDFSALGIEDPETFLQEKALVKVNGGDAFGDPSHVRLTFGCPRSQLKEALDRIEKAVLELNK